MQRREDGESVVICVCEEPVKRKISKLFNHDVIIDWLGVFLARWIIRGDQSWQEMVPPPDPTHTTPRCRPPTRLLSFSFSLFFSYFHFYYSPSFSLVTRVSIALHRPLLIFCNARFFTRTRIFKTFDDSVSYPSLPPHQFPLNTFTVTLHTNVFSPSAWQVVDR